MNEIYKIYAKNTKIINKIEENLENNLNLSESQEMLQNRQNIIDKCIYYEISNDLYKENQKFLKNEQNNINIQVNNLNYNNIDQNINIKQFNPKNYIFNEKEEINFNHPFSCKLFGSRGSGKTTWIINYLNFSNKINNFDRIIWISTSNNQELFNYLEINVQFEDPNSENIKNIYNQIYLESKEKDSFKKNLIILDDVMKDLRNNKIIQDFYTKGRHLYTSIFSLEQHLNYSNNIERGNSDYFLLFRINDIEAINNFKRKYCSELSINEINSIMNYCWKHNLPLIISISSILFKYRLNFNEKIFIEANQIKISKIEKDNILIQENTTNHKKKCKILNILCCFCSCICDGGLLI